IAAAMRWMVASSKVGSGDWDIRTTGAGLGARVAAGFRLGRAAAPGPTCAHTGADTAMAAPSAATMIDFRMGSPSLAGGNPIGMAVFGPAYPSPAKRGRIGERSEPGWGTKLAMPGDQQEPPTRPASLRSHSRRFASAFLMLRTAAEGRLCHPPPLRGASR